MGCGGSEKRSGKCAGVWGKMRRGGGGVRKCIGVWREVKKKGVGEGEE